MTKHHPEQGFSLVETLVALAVIAAMAGMLFTTIGASAGFSRDLAKRREAVMLAQSLLAQASIAVAADDMAERGRAGDLVWRVARKRVGGGARDNSVPLDALRIEVIDPSTGRRLTRVDTIRLAR